MPSDQELCKAAEDWKVKGNEAFQKSDIEAAIQAYSQGLVQVDRVIATPYLIKAAILSNRAMCYLKAAKLGECQDDCSAALALLDIENDTKLRAKLLFRRAKSLFLQANMPHKKTADDLQLAAKDCLSLLSFDPSNKEASKLLNTIRAQHATETKHSSNTPLARTLDAIKKKDDKILHNIKVLLGLLNNDTSGAGGELGRLGGVETLLELSKDPTIDQKPRYLCLQCIACAGSHPPFCRNYLPVESQGVISDIIIHSSKKPEEVDLVVGAMTIYLRLILHWDRDIEPFGEITGATKLDYKALGDSLCAAYESKNLTLIRAANDILSSWIAGAQREAVIRASLDNFVDLPIPKTKMELDQLSPQELSKYKQRNYQKKTRDQAWAFERAMTFIRSGGMEKMLQCTVAANDAILRREMTVAMGKIFAALEAEEKMQEAVRPLFGLKEGEGLNKPKEENLGVVIEEINEDEEEEKVASVDEEEETTTEISFEQKMERTALATALLLANGSVGGWAMGTNAWPQCREHITSLAGSNQKTAMCLVAELLAAAASVKETRPTVGGYLVETEIKNLVSHSDKDIRTAAASSVAKLGLAEQKTEDFELIGLLEAACYMLEDGELDGPKDILVSEKVPSADTGALSSLDRGVEVLSYLVSKTLIKEELAHGFKATEQSKDTGLELMVKAASRPGAGEALSAFGLASAFQLMAATPLQLRKEAFEGKQVTMEQYDELKSMQKTSEEKEFEDEEPELKEDSPEQCATRIGKMAAANVPRALCQLANGASDQTLEQVVIGLNRLANEASVRGTMIQQGVLSKLIKIEKDEKNPSDVRKKILRSMRHCIGKMLVTTNPGLLTSAQRMGSIKPLIQLVREVGSSDLQQFESLMALTNIASVGDDTKNKIVAERGLACFKFAMFSDHEMVKQAATEALVNMVGNQEFMKQLKEEEELRLWLAVAADFEAHYECARAASGCIAMATSYPEIAETLIKLPTFKQRMDETLESGSLEIMHRMLVVILNLTELGGEFREAAESNGLIAFAEAYVGSYHDGSKLKELEFGDDQLPTFNATVDVAKQILRACQ